MTAYITRYCLTDGIQEIEGETNSANPEYFYTGNMTLFDKRDWHTTREAAVAQAEQMRIKKIASLKKQIARLEKLKFE